MKPLFVLINMGMGDAILCNGLIRVLADRHGSIIIPSYPHNLQAVTFMFRDDPRIEVVEAQSSTHAAALAVVHGNSLLLGHYFKGKFDVRKFDQEFYSQANVEFKERWDRFFVECDWEPDIDPQISFLHHDSKRGFPLSLDHSPKTKMIVEANNSIPFFEWVNSIQRAGEIHCINSSFLILVDSLPEIPGQKLFFHRYPRPTDHPTLKKAWVIIE